MKQLLISLGKLARGFWRLLTGLRTAMANLLFLAVLACIALALLPTRGGRVPQGCALVLNPKGTIVETKSAIDPLARFLNSAIGSPVPEEILLQDILDVIGHAARDERIALLLLDPSGIEHASLNQLQAISAALDHFRRDGKKIIAAAGAYDQAQYYLAAHADEVYLHPMGQVGLRGLALFRLYAREMLEKLSLDVHVFRVGTYKSAVEPLLRDDMSPEDREANQLWLNRLWRNYLDTIARGRHQTAEKIQNIVEQTPALLQAVDGDAARLALESQLVDGLKTGSQVEKYLGNLVGSDTDQDFRHIEFDDYLATLTPSYTKDRGKSALVGIITAQGDIVQGKGGPGQIGSDTLTALLRRASDNPRIKAVVLRLDTGGGGVMASEIIRQEILELRQAGKPVTVSMGSLAASGGYWIASAADRIIAGETTLTGSIGIFGAIPSGNRALARLGLHSDGLTTGPMAGAMDITRPLPPELPRVIQLQIEEGYRRFLSLVAEGRSLPLHEVEKVAEGRVWDGRSALELGLVDELGGLSEAVAAAVELAGLKAEEAAALHLKSSARSRLGLLRLLGEALTRPGALTRLPAELAGRLAPELGLLSGPLLHGDPGSLYAHALLTPEMLRVR